ncbi:hypothetical protein I6A84_13720 [Frankia sp. CNm7]|uniref:Uncharacterized protein n=1 Tax=Frankia nepalensis TaxID=1836974 RepID=A0A937UQG5_9ACTN|nr:hypothetical protein [Frankia nepalensis]MBL7500904.1 hypothetical protein [Frankia nepalensis]MBL7510333.1 hypothetical protein [Frankia nepalensis]MBL7519137.1 hypothetical protein [Frankia nepalensis]MBL7626671.1 hypothetical protein [Frankia nepalensis]
MDEWYRSFVDPGFRYVFSQGPARVRCRQDALRDGLNCVALAHLAIRDLFGYALPASFQSVELFGDARHFEPVPELADLRAGDLVWLGVAEPRVPLDEFVPRYQGDELLNFRDFPVNHVAVHTGTRAAGDHLMLHASPVDGTNALWPLHRFRDYPRYRQIYAVRRLRRELQRRPAQ